MTRRFYILLLLVGFLWSTECPATPAKAKPADRKALEKAIAKAPGDTDLRCTLIGIMLTEGDTAAAEEQLSYALKLNQGGCAHIHHARIALSRGKRIDAAADCARAVTAGLMPDEEAFIHLLDSTPPYLVTMRLKMALQKEKANVHIPIGLGQLYLHRGDTAAAVSAFREAFQRGDTTMQGVIDSLQNGQWTSGHGPLAEADSSKHNLRSIAFTRNNGKLEVSCTLNGLRIKAEVDTLAKESTISGVEAHFMLKNGYVSQENIVNDNTLIIRETDFGNGLVLHGVRLHYIRAQEGTVIFCLDDLRALGSIVIREEKKEIQIYSTL